MDVGISFPRERDRWLMVLLAKEGFSKDELIRLNKVRLHQKVIFLSCVLGASGKMLDRKYLEKRNGHEKWYTVKFPMEKPLRKFLYFGELPSGLLFQ